VPIIWKSGTLNLLESSGPVEGLKKKFKTWIDLAEDRDRWRTLVNAVMNLLVPYNAENFLTS
jgi:hypothetical protein